jgi:hypothetical protein
MARRQAAIGAAEAARIRRRIGGRGMRAQIRIARVTLTG